MKIISLSPSEALLACSGFTDVINSEWRPKNSQTDVLVYVHDESSDFSYLNGSQAKQQIYENLQNSGVIPEVDDSILGHAIGFVTIYCYTKKNESFWANSHSKYKLRILNAHLFKSPIALDEALKLSKCSDELVKSIPTKEIRWIGPLLFGNSLLVPVSRSIFENAQNIPHWDIYLLGITKSNLLDEFGNLRLFHKIIIYNEGRIRMFTRGRGTGITWIIVENDDPIAARQALTICLGMELPTNGTTILPF